MFAVKRNQVVVTALAVMIAAAGYLNFTESKSSGEIANVDLNDPISYEALLNDDGSIATLADDEDTDGLEVALGEDSSGSEESTPVYDDTGAAVYVSATPDTYFVQAKLEREQSRASQKDMLTEI